MAWYPSIYAPRTGGAYDSHHRTAGIAGHSAARRLRGRSRCARSSRRCKWSGFRTATELNKPRRAERANPINTERARGCKRAAWHYFGRFLNTGGVIEPVGSTHERAPGTGRGIVSMVIGTSAIVFAAAAAVGVVFAFARPADARFMHQCSGKYHAAAKAGCGANAAKAHAPLPRGITLGIGDIVSVTIFEPPGGLFVPSDAGARPGNFVTLPNQIVDSNGNITAPYAGTIPAAGRTPSEVQQAINEALGPLPRYRSGK